MVIIEHLEKQNLTIENNNAENQAPLGKEKRRRLRRSLKLLPNLFTLCNAFFGFCALVLSAHKYPQAAAYFILFGASMDALDGRIARLTQSTSQLGMQLDTLADAVTFIVAPAFMMYMMDFNRSTLLGFLACAAYVLAGIFRLARFNVLSRIQTANFVGLPSTLAGCALAFAVLSIQLNDYPLASWLVIVLLSYLMVSRWHFPAFKKASMRGTLTALILVGVTIATLGFNHVLLLLYCAYLLIGITRTLYMKHSKKNRPQ